MTTSTIVGVPDGHPEAVCEDCKLPNVVWHAPNEVWNIVVRQSNGPDPMLCPTCFIKRAEVAGFDSIWRCEPVNAAEMLSANLQTMFSRDRRAAESQQKQDAADAARYRWLKERLLLRWAGDTVRATGKIDAKWEFLVCGVVQSVGVEMPSLDSAIDAAMANQQKEPT